MKYGMILSAIALAAPVSAQMNATADGAFHRADTAMARQWKTTYARMKALDVADTCRTRLTDARAQQLRKLEWRR